MSTDDDILVVEKVILEMIAKMKSVGVDRTIGAAAFLAAAECCRRSMKQENWEAAQSLAPLLAAHFIRNNETSS